MVTDIPLDTVLNRAHAGLSLAERIIAVLQRNESVSLDFSPVDRMTPSFANAFMMTLLEAYPREQLADRLFWTNRNEQVAYIMDESAKWYLQGLRLSSQSSAHT